jgi:transposase InsO family protein
VVVRTYVEGTPLFAKEWPALELSLRHDRRELLHLNVTDHPTADWTARQILQTFPEETAPRSMLRDRDTIYGESFIRCIASIGIREVRMAPRAPWQNAFVERVIGSIRRECLDHVIILSEAHLGRVLRAYLAYYNTTRPHQSLDNKQSPPTGHRTPTLWPDHRHSSGRRTPSPYQRAA